MKRVPVVAALFVLALPWASFAQGPEGHHLHHDMAPTDHAQPAGEESTSEHAGVPMHGMLGSYPMSREASGTSWQPDATPHEGVHCMTDDGMVMVHGFANVVYDDQGGERGDRDVFSSNMLMLMAQRPLGIGTFGARSMLSLEPVTLGKKGYPLLLQTGETADGTSHLIDRQHPHDFWMELAGTYSLPVTDVSSVFVYAGLPGEPALGPPAFLHRFSGVDNPEAPITHHWLDSTHISFGVATLGYVYDRVKLEGSVFTGREPDENRWDFETPRFDSYAARLSWNPTGSWALQGSYGLLDSPEQLAPETDTRRGTVSASYHKAWGRNNWQTTAAWGINANDPGHTLHGFLLESALNLKKTHTVFGRAETVGKDELFPEGDPLHGSVFHVTKLSLGYIYDLPEWRQMQWGVGGLGSLYVVSSRMHDAYDGAPVSFMLFVRAKL